MYGAGPHTALRDSKVRLNSRAPQPHRSARDRLDRCPDRRPGQHEGPAAKYTGGQQWGTVCDGAVPITGPPRGCSLMVEHELPKLRARVRFPSPAPYESPRPRARGFVVVPDPSRRRAPDSHQKAGRRPSAGRPARADRGASLRSPRALPVSPPGTRLLSPSRSLPCCAGRAAGARHPGRGESGRHGAGTVEVRDEGPSEQRPRPVGAAGDPAGPRAGHCSPYVTVI